MSMVLAAGLLEVRTVPELILKLAILALIAFMVWVMCR